MTFRLKAASGPRTGDTFDLSDDTLIGSGEDNQIRIEGLEGRHARIRFDGERLTLEAHAETHVNGEAVHTRALKSGDEIRLHANRFVLQAPGLRPPSILAQPIRPRISRWTWIAIGAVSLTGLAAITALILSRP